MPSKPLLAVPAISGRALAGALAATAVLLVLAALRHGPSWQLAPTAVLVVALVALSTIDLAVFRLPDPLVFGALGLSAVAMAATAVAEGMPGALGLAALGMALCFGLLLAAHLVSPSGLGFGDVKLGLLLGLHLGWEAGAGPGGPQPVIALVASALAAGCLLGVIWGLAFGLARRRARRSGSLWKQPFAFGPALAAGTLVVVFFGGGPVPVS